LDRVSERPKMTRSFSVDSLEPLRRDASRGVIGCFQCRLSESHRSPDGPTVAVIGGSHNTHPPNKNALDKTKTTTRSAAISTLDRMRTYCYWLFKK